MLIYISNVLASGFLNTHELFISPIVQMMRIKISEIYRGQDEDEDETIKKLYRIELAIGSMIYQSKRYNQLFFSYYIRHRLSLSQLYIYIYIYVILYENLDNSILLYLIIIVVNHLD